MGKLLTEDLKRLLNCVRDDSRVVVKPQLGFDAGVHMIDGDRYMVVSTDPCVGVPETWFGWLLINYVASDIALFGAKTEFCTVNLLGASSTEPEVFHNVMKQACDAADELGIAIVTGHTGTYNGLSTLVGVCTGYGHINKDRLITPAGAQQRDYVACIKPVGSETAINFALTHRALAENLFGAKRTKELTKLVTMQSCVREALLLAEIEGVHTMHDATEGGLTAALNEMAETSNVGFRVEWKEILFQEEAQKLREAYSLSDMQMLSMSSTGTILAAVSPEARDKVEAVLRQNGVDVRFLGSFTKSLHRVLVKNGDKKLFPREADDPYSRFVSAKQ
jgi:hydrogenase expression/formation protein HypE